MAEQHLVTAGGSQGQDMEKVTRESVLQNPMLMSRILRFLRLTELKSVRLVAPSWNQISRNDFLHKGLVEFCTSANMTNSCGTPYSEYIIDYPNYNHENISLEFNLINGRESQFVTTMTCLLQVARQQLKSLKYQQHEQSKSVSLFYPQTFDLLNSALTLEPNLVELDLRIRFSSWDRFNLDLFLGGDIVLHSVEKAKFQFFSPPFQFYVDNSKVEGLSRKLIRLVPNVQSLEFGYCDYPTFPVTFFQEALSFMAFPKLHMLKQYGSGEEVLSLGLELPNPLREIDFRIIGGNQLLEMGPEVFKTHFPSLISLRVDTDHWQGHGKFDQEIYDSFFSTGDDLEFPQFTELDVCYPEEGIPEYISWAIRMARMFPNVHNYHLTNARSTPI